MSDSEETSSGSRRKAADIATPAPVKRTVEEWATDKKFLPARFPGTPAMRHGERVIPGTGAKPNPQYERFYAAKCGKGWVVGAEVTEAEFDEAMTMIDKPI